MAALLFSYAIALWLLAIVDWILVLIRPSLVYGKSGLGRKFGTGSAIVRILLYFLLIGLFVPEDRSVETPFWPFLTALLFGALWRFARPPILEQMTEESAAAKNPTAQPPKSSPAPAQPATVKPTAKADGPRVPPGTSNAETLEAAWRRIDRIRANAEGFSDARLHDALMRITDTTAEIIAEVIDDPDDFSRARETLAHDLANVDEIAADLRKLDAKGEAAAPIANALPVLEAIDGQFRRVKSTLFDNDRFNLDVRLRHLMGKLDVDWAKMKGKRKKKPRTPPP